MVSCTISFGGEEYTEEDNISRIEITNSDQQYYQTAFVEMFNIDMQYPMNTFTIIKIDGTQVFTGYISRIEEEIDKGVKYTRYQLIGQTYDLWRYSTDDNAIYSGTTAYIASSLISTYCKEKNIKFNDYNPNAGYNLVNDINLTNITVGDAIVKLTEYDGYSFYIDNGVFYYYKNTNDRTFFTITDEDLIEADPIEQSDENIVNDCLVIGGAGYSKITNIAKNAQSSQIFLKSPKGPYGIRVAQQFKAEDDVLTGLSMYLDRTRDVYRPDELDIEVWENSERIVFNDDFNNYDYLNTGSALNNIVVRDGYLELGYKNYITRNLGYFTNDYNGFIDCNDTIIYKFCRCNSDGVLERVDIQFDKNFNKIDGDYCRVGLFYSGSRRLVLQTDEITSDGMAGWKSFETRPSSVLSGQNYILAIWGNLGEKSIKTGFITESIRRKTIVGGYSRSGNGDWNRYWNPFYTGGFTITDNYCPNIRLVYRTTPLNEKYFTSGSIQSKFYTYPYPGSKKNRYDCRYMRIDLMDVVSSNCIFISGTNNDGSTWQTLENERWIDMGTENKIVGIKYKFSSNGTYTPKIDACKLTISDSAGGFENVIYNDTFSNWDKLSGSSLISCNIVSGYLQISGHVTYSWVYPDSAVNVNNFPWGSNYVKYYDKNESTCATRCFQEPDGSGGGKSDDVFTYNSPINVGTSLFLKAIATSDGYEYVTLDYAGVSGLHTGIWGGGWRVLNDSHAIQDTDGNLSFEFEAHHSPKYHISVNKLKYSFYFGWWGTQTCCINAYETKVKSFSNIIRWNGSIKTSSMSTILDTHYLKPVLTGKELGYVSLSGSCDGGKHWTRLVNNVKTLIQYPGKKVILAFYLKPWTTYGDTLPNTPKIDTAKLIAYGNIGGGIPKSGSRVEWSNDAINISAIDVPYPPSYSSWKKYSPPRLRLTEGDYYWLIMQHPSGGVTGGKDKKYWTYYYDPKSSYGNTTWSWDNGYKWSTSVADPEQVTAGDIRLKLGWSEGEIKATATNEASIQNFGRHFKKIYDSSITSVEEAKARAELEVSGTQIPRQGKFIVDGRPFISNTYLFSANLSKYGINDKFSVKSYTHRIDRNGFTTEIVYGRHQFDIAQKISRLEQEVGLK